MAWNENKNARGAKIHDFIIRDLSAEIHFRRGFSL
jgi:hypothetical protein